MFSNTSFTYILHSWWAETTVSGIVRLLQSVWEGTGCSTQLRATGLRAPRRGILMQRPGVHRAPRQTH